MYSVKLRMHKDASRFDSISNTRSQLIDAGFSIVHAEFAEDGSGSVTTTRRVLDDRTRC